MQILEEQKTVEGLQVQGAATIPTPCCIPQILSIVGEENPNLKPAMVSLLYLYLLGANIGIALTYILSKTLYTSVVWQVVGLEI